MKRNKLLIVLFIIVSNILFGNTSEKQEVLLNEYESLLNEYESLLTEGEEDLIKSEKAQEVYEKLLEDYETLFSNYEKSKEDLEKSSKDYIKLTDKFNILNETYLLEIEFHKSSKEALVSSRFVLSEVRQSLKDILSITDNTYFTMYTQLGYLGDEISIGFAIGARVPNFPVSFLFDVDYLPSNEKALNLQIGVGIRF